MPTWTLKENQPVASESHNIFKDEAVAIAGCVLLALSLVSLLLVCTVCKVVLGFFAIIWFIVSGRRCSVDSNRVCQELHEVTQHVKAKEEA